MAGERGATATLTGTAFATLLLIALMMGANPVAARLAFDHGLGVATAVAMRSGATALADAAPGAQAVDRVYAETRGRRRCPTVF